MRDSTVERVPNSATRFRPRALNRSRDHRHHVDQRNAQQRQELRGADMRRDRHDRRHLGAARGGLSMKPFR